MICIEYTTLVPLFQTKLTAKIEKQFHFCKCVPAMHKLQLF